jgi:hypothetical protein
MMDLIRDPETFFEDIAKFGRISRAMGVLFAVGFAYSLQGITLFATVPNPSEFFGGMAGFVFGDFAQPFMLWAIFVATALILGTVLGGRPSSGRMVKTLAWSMVPLIATGISFATGRFLAYQDAAAPEPMTYGGFAQEASEIQEVIMVPNAGDPELLAFRALGTVFILVFFYYAVYAVKAASDLDFVKSVAVVVPPALFYLANVTQVLDLSVIG